MAPEIGNLVSSAFYDGKLENGNRSIPDIYNGLPEALQFSRNLAGYIGSGEQSTPSRR